MKSNENKFKTQMFLLCLNSFEEIESDELNFRPNVRYY